MLEDNSYLGVAHGIEMNREKLERLARQQMTAAHHEAGHAVAAFHIGAEIKNGFLNQISLMDLRRCMIYLKILIAIIIS